MRGKAEKTDVDETWDDGITMELGAPSQSVGVPAAEIQVGQVLLGRYRIEARLGSGGMGTVYKAEDRVRSEHAHMDGQVALKIADAGPNKPASVLDKLRHEFYCAQALSHPSIVKVYELGGNDELAFFTMELLDGERLSELMKRSPKGLPRPQAWSIIREIGDGLAHAHSRNVVHADLKPQNVMVLKSGGIRILDFGTASIEMVGNGGSAFTPSYASCQLLEGQEADGRDDVFALACIAYELLAGEHPFQRRRATEARDAGMTAKEPKNLSQGQWQALRRGLAWESEDRPNSVQEWLTELVLSAAPRWKGAREEEVVAAGPRKFGLGSMRWVLAVTLPLALVAGWAVIHSLSNKPAVAAPPAIVKAPELAPIPLPSEEDLKEQEAKMTDIDESVPVPSAPPKVRRVAAKPTGPVIEKIAFSENSLNLGASARFAEVHVFRSAAQSEKTSFVWWTEAGSASPDLDFLSQGHTTAYFSAHSRMTTLFVKVVPNPKRKKPQVFYLNIADAGNGAVIGPTSRIAITLLPRGA
jgi:hypothetical protein